MRRAVSEMNVHMIGIVAREEVSKVKSIACALFCLGSRSIGSLVLFDQFAWPFAGCAPSFCILFPDSENLLGRRVVNRCTQPGNMFVPQTGERRMNRANPKVDTEPLQGQHLRIAKRLRNDGIARVKITKSHCGKRTPKTGRGTHSCQAIIGSYPESEIRNTK